MPGPVFISYASEDREIAFRLCDALERGVAPCWIAPRDIVGGVKYGEAIVRAIKESRVLLLVFSESADASEHVAREVTLAVSNNVRIVPFCIDETPPSGHLEYVLSTPHRLAAHAPPLEVHLPRLEGAIVEALAPRDVAGAAAAVREAATSLKSGRAARGEIPELVPYLVDRKEQELQIQRHLHEAWRDGATHPVSLLLHGDESECLDGFMDRLHEISLPRLLRRSERGDRVTRIQLTWPHRPDPTATRLRRLHEELCERLDLPPAADEVGVRQAIGRLEHDLVSVSANVYSRHWTGDEPELVRSWLRWWNAVAPLSPARTVCVFVNLHYTPATGWLGRMRDGRVKSRIAGALRALAADPALAPPPLLADELLPVTQADVEDWARTHGREHCRVRDIESLVASARGLFSARRSNEIPMRPLVGELHRLAEQMQG